ncbi:MAG: S9 family peptidase, partial [Chitinophagaceae bacterium]
MRKLLFWGLLFAGNLANGQTPLGKLTVEKIMRDPKWIGTSPAGLSWSADSKYLFFNWNPAGAPADSLYFISKENKTPVKADPGTIKQMVWATAVVYNSKRTAYA